MNIKINYKKILFFIFITFLIGASPSVFIKQSVDGLLLPKLYPPMIVFPIVWSILYILMGISIYIFYEKTKKISIIYIIQILLNSLWTIIFFGLKMYFLGFIIIIVLFTFVLLMIIEFYKVNKLSGYLQMPYSLWLIIAAYLNLSIVLLNV